MLLHSTVSISACSATVAVSYSGALHGRVVSTGTSWLPPLLAMDLNLPKMHMGNSLSKNLQDPLLHFHTCISGTNLQHELLLALFKPCVLWLQELCCPVCNRLEDTNLSMQKFSSNVVEKCLKVFKEVDKAKIILEILATPHLEQLLQHPYANYVIYSALQNSKVNLMKRISSLEFL
jgi:hypothetical protein